MSEAKTKEYTKDDLTVVWDQSKCTHAALCAKGLPSVFKPRERPWVQMDGADVEAIANQVRRCPSGALSLKE